jgi:subfamily B ATP-binding cassette protein MsbA
MSRRTKNGPAANRTDEPRLRDLVRYLKRHRLRLVVAFFAMIGVGFFGSFNFLLLRPALEVMLGGRESQNAVEIVYREDGTTRTLTVANVIEVKDVEVPQETDKRVLLKIGFLRTLKAKWDGLVAPIGARLKRWDQQLKDYGRRRPMNGLLLIAALMVGMSIIHGICDFVSQYHMTYALLDMVRRLKDDLFRHVLSQDYLFFVRQSTGYLESRIQSDVNAIHQTADALLTDAVQAPLQIFFLLLVLLILNFQLTVVAAIVLPLAVIPLVYFAKLIRRVTRRQKRQADQLASAMEESLRNFQVIKCFQSEDLEVERFAKRNLKLFYYHLKQRVARFASSPLMELLGALGGAGVLLFGGYMILRGQMDFSSLMVYLVALTRFYSPMRKLSRINTVLQTGKVSADRILEMMRLRPELHDRPDALPLDRITEGIAFRDVTFVYDDQAVLDGISFEVPVGRTMAVVGPSGAGKTTLACLLMRLFDPPNGCIEIDGRNVRDYRISDVRRRFAMVTQETVLFNDSVARNIAYPEKEPDRERIERAARLANAHEFVQALDGGQGYDTVIGQSGQLLSGGQRQRIAIARAINHDPDVLVFDEATSALDEKSQALVQEAINNLLQGRTAFIIAHRLSTVRNADEVLVLEHGRLVERGTHDDLIHRGGVYAALYQMVETPQPSG